MTDLTKPVKRRATIILDNRIKERARDKIVVTLYPDGTIGFRPSRCRKEYTVPIVTCYRAALQAHALEVKKQKTEAKKQRRMVLR